MFCDSKLPAAVAAELVQALLDQIPYDDQTAVIAVKQDNIVSPPTNGQPESASQPKYDPSVAYILEFCTILALRDEDSIELMGKPVFDTVWRLLRDPNEWHPLALSRATFHALSILKSSYVRDSFDVLQHSLILILDTQDYDFVNVTILLHAISNLPKPVLVQTSDAVVRGLSACTEEPGPLRSEMMTSPDFWAILRTLAINPESAASVFSILENGTTGNPPAIIADNFEAAISLLNFFASAAGSRPGPHPRPDPNPRRVDRGPTSDPP